MNLFDNTLRDGGNVVGHGFSAELTVSIVKGLLDAGIQDIELGNCKGIGAYEKLQATKALSDREYLKILEPYVSQGRLGMFLMAKLADETLTRTAKDGGLTFLRVGANAGDGAGSVQAVELVKKAGLICRYSLMKAYVSTPEELAREAKMLQNAGVDMITIMDSAGTMFPQEAVSYVKALKAAVTIPVGFHGHSNLGLSQANALAAVAAGADEIDCGLLGMARSAGNCATELAAATLKKEGYLQDVDLYGLLDYLDQELIPAMKPYGYHVAVTPTDLMLGLAGCHSNFLPMFRKVAEAENVSLHRLIADVSAVDRKNPSEELLREIARKLK
jgi:4-hydroxy 2-oxovalerate aldolase